MAGQRKAVVTILATAHAVRNLSRAPKGVLEKCWFKDIVFESILSRLPAPMFCALTFDMKFQRLTAIFVSLCSLIPALVSAQAARRDNRPSLDAFFGALKKT